LESNIDSPLGSQSLNVWRNRETLLTGGLLIVVALGAWAMVISQAAQMRTMSGAEPDASMSSTSMAAPTMDGAAMGMEMPDSSGDTDSSTENASPTSSVSNTISMPLTDTSGYLIAWGVMMAAMMLPSAMPMIAFYGAIKRNFSQNGQRGIPTLLFALIYLALWLAFGIPVYIASVLIDRAVTANPGLANLLPYALAVVLLVAGAFQFSTLKRVCLHSCRSPISFLFGRWRSGYVGTSRMAFEHSAYCIGCCWGLMVVLVAAGAMALQWVLLIAVLVFVEKLLPHGEWAARVIGGVLILLGLLVVMQPNLISILPG
jgi:predicted metal-binding membrane protein